jgi:hypothetical protein
MSFGAVPAIERWSVMQRRQPALATNQGRNTMSKARLRFSGWHIPFEHRDANPCWEFALDEEGEEGQDETTMRPCDEPVITEYTDVVTARAIGANGVEFPAIVSLEYPDREANGVMIYVDRKFEGRVVEFSMRDGKWTEYESKPNWYDAWTSAKYEPGLLPVKLITVAKSKRTGKPLSFTVADLA